MIFKRLLLGAAAAWLAFLPLHAQAQSVADFYKGKDIRFLISGSVGGGFGTYALFMSKYLKKFMPGNPNFVVEPMPGAAGLKMANYMIEAGPKDGTVISFSPLLLVLWTTFKQGGLRHGADEFHYIGRIARQENLVVVSKESGVRNLEDAKGKVLRTGASTPDSQFATSPLLVNHVVGTKFKIVPGYNSSDELLLAMAQNEIAAANTGWENVMIIKRDQVASGKIIPLISISEERYKGAPYVPAVGEFIKDPIDRVFFQTYASFDTVGKSILIAAGVPADRVEALRKAFDAMVADPEFLADAKAKGIDVNPISGVEAEARVKAIVGAPADQVAAAKKLYLQLIAEGGG